MKTVLLSKKTRGNKVIVSLDLHYGTEADFKGRTEAAGFIGPLLMAGTTRHSKREIEDEFDRLKAQVSTGGGMGGGRRRMGGGGGGRGPGIISVNIETIRKNLPAVLDLVAECLKESNFPEKEFEKMRKQRMAGIEQNMSEPAMLAMTEVRRRMLPVASDDVRYVPTPAEQIERLKAVKLDDVKRIYRELVGAGNAELAVVGDFDASEVTTLIDHHFKNWKSAKPFERIAMPHFDIKGDAIAINTPDKTNAVFGVGTTIAIRDDDPDYPALMMANYILGGNASSRLLSRIRQKEGLSYGVNSQLQASSQDRTGVFIAFGICNPKNVGKAMACAREEIDRLLKNGVTDKELQDAKKGYAQQFEVSLSQDRMVAEMLGRQAYLGRTMKFTQEQLDQIQALTVEEVNAAARKYIKPETFVAVRAGDLAGKAGAEDPADAHPTRSRQPQG